MSYQWRRNGAGISGETANTYTKVVADAGQSINCLVTATNAKGSSYPVEFERDRRPKRAG